MDYIIIDETVQAGDTFLIKFKCNSCGNNNFNDWNNLTCYSCRQKSGYFFEFSNDKSKFRCLTGTRRKQIRFNKKKIATLKEIQGNACAYCDLTMLDFHIEHVVPISFGGSNNISNIVLSCPSCNLKAGSKVFPSFADKRAWIQKARKLHLHN